jgi:hypothetical protein
MEGSGKVSDRIYEGPRAVANMVAGPAPMHAGTQAKVSMKIPELRSSREEAMECRHIR